MTPKQLAEYKADFIAWIIVPIIFLFLVVIAKPDAIITLKDNPCAPHQVVKVNGKDMGCTGSQQSAGNMWWPKTQTKGSEDK